MDLAKTAAAAFVLVTTLDGCTARSGTYSFSVHYSNCQPRGLAFLSFKKGIKGTICGPVNEETANYICFRISSGSAVNFGTAASEGKQGGSGTIAVKNLMCNREGGCSFSTDTGDCLHSQDLILQCTGLPCISTGILLLILAIAIFIIVACCFGVWCCLSRSQCSRNRRSVTNTPSYGLIT